MCSGLARSPSIAPIRILVAISWTAITTTAPANAYFVDPESSHSRNSR
jgi:hypothetical protein